MLTALQFKTLLNTVLDILQDLLATKSNTASVMFAGFRSAITPYEEQLLQKLQDKGIVKQ